MDGEGETEAISWWAYVGVGLLWFGANRVLEFGGVQGEAAYLWVAAAFIATFGLACLVNGQRCGALHCRVSGPGYLLVALLAVAGALGLVDVGRGLVFALFGGVFVASYAAEFLAARTGGSAEGV